MKGDVVWYVVRWLTCKKVKAERQRPHEKMQSLDNPIGYWEEITMDFIMKLPRTACRVDLIWIIVDRFTKSVYFFPDLGEYLFGEVG